MIVGFSNVSRRDRTQPLRPRCVLRRNVRETERERERERNKEKQIAAWDQLMSWFRRYLSKQNAANFFSRPFLESARRKRWKSETGSRSQNRKSLGGARPDIETQEASKHTLKVQYQEKDENTQATRKVR